MVTDTLRDRIAAVLYRNLRRQQGIDRPDRFLDWIDTSELADAVIRELGLRQEHQQGPYNFLYRYATDWMTDD
jgi:hypothetical protein